MKSNDINIYLWLSMDIGHGQMDIQWNKSYELELQPMLNAFSFNSATSLAIAWFCTNFKRIFGELNRVVGSPMVACGKKL